MVDIRRVCRLMFVVLFGTDGRRVRRTPNAGSASLLRPPRVGLPSDVVSQAPKALTRHATLLTSSQRRHGISSQRVGLSLQVLRTSQASSLFLGVAGLRRQRRWAAQNIKRRATSADSSQRVAVITGGTSRIGAATARGLAESGKYARLILVGRDETRAAQILEDLHSAHPHVSADFLRADLASLAEVRELCTSLARLPLHSLICFAGATALPRREVTSDGHEYHFGLNFLSRFLMVNLLLEQLRKAGTPDDPARVVLVTTKRHWGTPVLGFSNVGAPLPLALGDLDDLQLERHGAYDAWKAFGQAAFCNIAFAYELQRRLQEKDIGNVALNCFDPGPLSTAWRLYQREENRMLATGIPEWAKELFSYFTRLVETPESVATTPVRLATSLDGALPCLRPRAGSAGYWERTLPTPSKYPLPWSAGTSYDEAVWQRLWTLAEDAVRDSS